MASSSSDDMETISVAVKSPTHSQFLAPQGIFSAPQSSQGQRTAGPLITEIITGGGNYQLPFILRSNGYSFSYTALQL